MEFQNILLEQVEAGIYQLTINRPERYNALNAATLDELSAAAGWLEGQEGVRVLLITGAGNKSFVAGADIKEMQAKNPLEGQLFGRKGLSVFRQIETLPFPVIAVVNGFALGGGCELALSCDWVIAAENALFGQPEVALGVTPGFGGSQRLPRLIGRSKAMEMITTGRKIDAATALTWGLVNHVFPQDQLLTEAMRVAREIAAQGPVAVRLSKQAVLRGQEMELETACMLEEQLFALCFSTEDQKEGMAAFVEKRKAVFKGK